ncbi:MAG TPA: two-component regulator propeller domain-containing protein [Saprospiraceae bacterium]|nr:two-component regulator propeller domain-containing protein [Saprospiraceae bacterium]
MKILLLITLLSYNFSCSSDRKLNEQKIQNESSIENATDTLKFTKGLRSICQDNKGNYWIGSNQEGVCKYDGKTFTYYTTENGFCGKQVISIKEDASGTIWFGTSSGLCSYDGTKFNSNTNATEIKFWTTNKTDLWFPGNNGNGLIKIDKEFNYTTKNPIEIPLNTNPIDYGITGFSVGKMNDLWIAYYKGVAHYDGISIQYINDSKMNFDGKSSYMHVRSILEDSKGRLWIGNNGIGVMLKEGNAITHFSREKDLIKGELFVTKSPAGSLMHVFAIKEDSKGNIWFGDRDTGAWRYDGKEIKNFIVDSKLNSQHIWDIYEDKKGNLLFVMADNSVYKFNGDGFNKFF